VQENILVQKKNRLTGSGARTHCCTKQQANLFWCAKAMLY